MFGIYRTALAVVVVLDHFGSVPVASMTMVFGFYCLSGFLMTALMDGAYRCRIGAFFANRALRLYPMYWALIAATVWYIGACPWQHSTGATIRQLFLINLWPEAPFFVSVAWAVTNEIVFYILIGFGISKTLPRTLAWFSLSVVLTAAVLISLWGDATALDRQLYYSKWCGTLPFSLGALAYHLRDRITVKPSLLIGCGLPLLAVAMVISGLVRPLWYGFYLGLVANAVIVLGLYPLKIAPRLDDLVGRFSYPIYIFHVAAFGVLTNEGLVAATKSFGTFVAVLAMSVAMAAVALITIDWPVQIMRGRIRSDSLIPRRAAKLAGGAGSRDLANRASS